MENEDIKVEECNFYNKIQSCERCELGSIKYQGKSSYKYHIDCRQNPKCYFKQLQRKEEEIKKALNLFTQIFELLGLSTKNTYLDMLNKINDMKNQNEQMEEKKYKYYKRNIKK